MPQAEEIQLRNGTAAQWTSANPILNAGELGVETDSHQGKIGDGVTSWVSLPYIGGASTGGTFTSPTIITPIINGTATGTGASATPAASILAEWDANKNLSASNVFEGFTTQAASATTLALTITSTETQVITGTTQTQLITLPTTSVPAGATWTILNQTTAALVTVQSSAAGVIAILPPATGGEFYALVATPTTAANWNYRESGQLEQLGLAITVTAAGTTALTFASADTQVFTGTSTQVVTLPSAGVPAGADYTIVNESTGVVTVQSSGANNVALLPGSTSGLFVAMVPTPTTAANWIYLEQGELSQLGNTSTATAAGTTTLTALSTTNQVFTGSTTQVCVLPTTGVPQGAQYMIINQSTGVVTVQSSNTNVVLALAGAAAAPYACATFTALVNTPTTSANWDYSGQGAANAILGTPASGTLTNCTLPWKQLTGATAPVTGAATSGTTQTVLATYSIPANTLAAGSTFGINLWGSLNATLTTSLIFNIYIGTNGTTADTLVTTTPLVAVAASAGASMSGMVTIRTTGSGGTCIGGATAQGTASTVSTTAATVTVNTTVANFITVAAANASASSIFTAQTLFISPGGA
jgi:Major tropism determinant N-terminal domain